MAIYELGKFGIKYHNKKLNIFGAEYTIKVYHPEDNEAPKDVNGLCEVYTKELVIKDYTAVEDEKQYKNIYGFVEKVLRHEILHAIFYEAGQGKYFEDEDLVDALAVMMPKISKILQEVNNFK